MKRDFPQGTPLEVQLLSVAAMHTPGRKHQKRKGVKASERTRANARGSAAEKHRREAPQVRPVPCPGPRVLARTA